MNIKRVMRWSDTERMLRLFRVMWDEMNYAYVGGPQPVSHKVSVGLQSSLFYFDRSWDGWRATILGIHVSHRSSAGGRYV